MQSKLSLRERIGQTIMIKADPELHVRLCGSLEAFLEKYPVGGLFVGAEIIRSVQASSIELTEMIRRYQQASKIPLLIAADVESGAGGIVSDLTLLPRQMSLGATESPELAYAYGAISAAEATAMGINWSFSPVCDLNLNPHNVIINSRAVSDHPDKALKLLIPMIKGMQEHGLAATAKHFPGDGVDHRDQHLVTTCNSLTYEQWEANHGKVFRKLVEEGVQTVMAGHITLPAVQTRKHRGCFLPATLSEEIITGLLKERMGFQGVVVSDALDMGGFVRVYGNCDIAEIEAFKAGIDVMLWPFLSFFDHLEAAIHHGKVGASRLKDAVARVLQLKENVGLLNKTDAPAAAHPKEKSMKSPVDGPLLARTVARQSITLVENKLNVLPLRKRRPLRIRMVGVTPNDELYGLTDTIREELEKRSIQVETVRNLDTYGQDYRLMDQDFDYMLYVLFYAMQKPLGTSHYYESEARSVVSALSFAQERTIILSFGSPYYYAEYFESADTFINCCSSDPETLKAAVAALFGEIPFAGKSPVELYGRMDGL
ncbi:MAG: hypothetical protein K0R57_4095 [Paenibacillaceae bacterium]|jgi:beta-N-acetylhexosaminidase|nr:hypothetical protein [Paenibacillaceae bacterium]